MADYTFKLPDVGEGTAEAEIVAWHVAVGDRIEEDQPLVDVMTDKATVEMTTPVSGVVVSLHGEPGEMAPVGAPLAVIALESAGAAEHGARASSPPPPQGSKGGQEVVPPVSSRPSVERAKGRQDAGGAAPAPITPRVRDAKPLASPAVRRQAFEAGVALQFVPGSGPGGRIGREDLDAHLAAGMPTPVAGRAPPAWSEAVKEVKIIGLRRKIAEKMQDAKRRIPHFAYVEEVDVTELEALRVHLNATKSADQPRLTVLPFLICALTRTLPRYPQINARFDDDAGVVHLHEAVHMGIATQTAGGLVVPVVRHAEALDLWQLATEIARLAAATRDGKAKADELRGSTITLTSLGPLGGVVTTPVINHPEVAIIGPNKIVDRPMFREGAIVVRKMMNLSSSFDHRVVDGYDAAAFIQEVKAMLEHPATIFMDRP
ncbi:MAG: dihydrolipoamide acetyltransferase family protein [Caulobacteraceae bacterium]